MVNRLRTTIARWWERQHAEITEDKTSEAVVVNPLAVNWSENNTSLGQLRLLTTKITLDSYILLGRSYT